MQFTVTNKDWGGSCYFCVFFCYIITTTRIEFYSDWFYVEKKVFYEHGLLTSNWGKEMVHSPMLARS